MSNQIGLRIGMLECLLLCVIPLAFVLSILIFNFVFSNAANFQGGDSANEPIKDGVGYILEPYTKGGIIVPILLTMFLVVLTFAIEHVYDYC